MLYNDASPISPFRLYAGAHRSRHSEKSSARSPTAIASEHIQKLYPLSRPRLPRLGGDAAEMGGPRWGARPGLPGE